MTLYRNLGLLFTATPVLYQPGRIRKLRVAMNIAKQICATVLLGLMASTASLADEDFDNRWYLGAGVGISDLDPDTSGTIYSVEDSRDSGYLLYLGYDLFERISIEGHYTDLGEAGISPTGKIDYKIFGLGGLYYFYDDEQDHRDLTAFFKAGLGVMKNDSDLKYERQNDGHIFFGAGLEYGFDNGFALRTELDLYDEDAHLLTLSLLKRFGDSEPEVVVMDDDQDGVINSNDQCPQTARGVKVDTSGCEPDGDQDGVVDRVDQCPASPRGANVDASGCEPDGDRDGVVDRKDLCLNTVAGVSVDINGCALDSDKDSVVDSLDKCPDSGPFVRVDSVGCSLDRDKDGILDSHDKCLDSEPFVRVDSTGCAMAKVTILKGVLFDTGSAQLKDESRAALDVFASTLKRYSDMVVEVVGYTDSLGSRRYNEQLSDRRAKSVVNYLISVGVDGRNMTAKGYGPADPVADNATAAGRAENRRVELHILDR